MSNKKKKINILAFLLFFPLTSVEEVNFFYSISGISVKKICDKSNEKKILASGLIFIYFFISDKTLELPVGIRQP